jgi:hypothetical protein
MKRLKPTACGQHQTQRDKRFGPTDRLRPHRELPEKIKRLKQEPSDGGIIGMGNFLRRAFSREDIRSLYHLCHAGLSELALLALMRRHELFGFIEALFNDEDAVDLHERAYRGLDLLGEIH